MTNIDPEILECNVLTIRFNIKFNFNSKVNVIMACRPLFVHIFDVRLVEFINKEYR